MAFQIVFSTTYNKGCQSSQSQTWTEQGRTGQERPLGVNCTGRPDLLLLRVHLLSSACWPPAAHCSLGSPRLSEGTASLQCHWTQVQLLVTQKPMLERQLLVERKGCFISEAGNWGRRQTCVQRPAPHLQSVGKSCLKLCVCVCVYRYIYLLIWLCQVLVAAPRSLGFSLVLALGLQHAQTQ